jgi:hypothetical protein
MSRALKSSLSYDWCANADKHRKKFGGVERGRLDCDVGELTGHVCSVSTMGLNFKYIYSPCFFRLAAGFGILGYTQWHLHFRNKRVAGQEDTDLLRGS